MDSRNRLILGTIVSPLCGIVAEGVLANARRLGCPFVEVRYHRSERRGEENLRIIYGYRK
jgi:hypothetical protein